MASLSLNVAIKSSVVSGAGREQKSLSGAMTACLNCVINFCSNDCVEKFVVYSVFAISSWTCALLTIGGAMSFFVRLSALLLTKLYIRSSFVGVAGAFVLLGEALLLTKLFTRSSFVELFLMFIELSIVISSMELSSVFGVW